MGVYINGVEMPDHYTNADRIRAITDEELATILAEAECPSDLGGKDKCKNGTTDFRICRECWLDWLRQEVKDAT